MNGLDEHHAMLWQLIAELAAIDAKLGLPEDGFNSTALQTFARIHNLILESARLEDELARRLDLIGHVVGESI